MDDHRRVLDSVSALLADDFEVAGAVAEGREALDIAPQVDPDVIVLDVDMPGLDGFQTLRALRQGGVTTPVVFLSQHHADEIVSEAFRCGGRGYVLKSRVARDLSSAIDHAILGRLFVPSLTALVQLATRGHALQVYAGVESLLDGVAVLYDLALRRGEATCVIGTPEVREGLATRLRARGWDVGQPSGHKGYLPVDAADGLDRFMRNGFPDRDQLALVALELDQFRRAVAGESSRLMVFGNMASALSVEARSEAVIAVEHYWGALTQDLPFFTLCGYARSCFHDGVPDLWSGVSTEHWALSHSNDM